MYRITSIKFKNHEVFGNREFDFTDECGNLFDVVVIAGSNGVGKTLLLNEINSFYYQQSYSIFSYHNTQDINVDSDNKLITLCLKFDAPVSFASIHNQSESKLVDYIELYQYQKNDSGKQFQAKFFYNKNFVNINANFNFYSIYSKVNINYNNNGRVSTIGSKKLDENLDDRNLSVSYENPENLISLFVDIYNQDAIDFMEANNGKKEVINIDRRIDRFTNAFKCIFGNKLKFKSIKENVNVRFEKNKKDFDIYSLSSGEKQIVYRGMFLLRNKESTKGAVALIDEPEISMHPEWEEQIYNYYKNIFTVNEKQTSQIFFVTHSEHVLKSAYEDKKALIVKIDDSSCHKYYNDSCSTVLPYITMAEIKYSIFNIYSVDFHVLLFSYIQNHLGFKYITEVDNYFLSNGCDIKQYVNRVTGTTYNSLTVYIRNSIDHPDNNYIYSNVELKKSIEYMIHIISTF